jgi:mannosidase alpha-like ER degradation enhancer 2
MISGFCFMRTAARLSAVALLAIIVPGMAVAQPSGTPTATRGDSLAAAGRAQLAERVKAELLHAWNGYRTYAWGYDELKPLSRSGSDWYGESLVMTPVDAFSTLKIMGLDEQAAEAKRLILEKLSFDKNLDVQLFEINIRLLGGLLAAYQLDGDDRFLKLAVGLGNRLLPAFDSPTGMPYRFVNLVSGATSDAANNPAEIGTLLLEWGTLSRHTGNPVYYAKAKQALRALFERRSGIDLVGSVIDVDTGSWKNTESHISGGIDSYYEYLLKGWLMFGDEDLRQMWETSSKAVEAHLPEQVESGFWYGRVDMRTGARTHRWFGALDAFFPAVLVLGGDLDRARVLQESCYKLWMLHGIEPELIDYSTMEVLHAGYVLRPENIESAYYLYHDTGNPRYLDMGRQYLDSLVEFCRNDVAYAALSSVVSKQQVDAMPSFFLAETLKYLYLLFADQGTVDFHRTLFNTEAHPLKIWRE